MYYFKKGVLRFAIPLLLVAALSIRFVQMSTAQSPSGARQEVQSAPATSTKWNSQWNKFFARHEAILKRPLTPEEKQNLAAAYREYRQDVAAALGLKLTDLVRKEKEAASALLSSPTRTAQTPSATEPITARKQN